MPRTFQFRNQADFDRMAKAVRWSEQQRKGDGDRIASPIQPGAGVVNVRVLSRRQGSAIFGDEVEGLDDPKGPYYGRLVYRNLDAKCKDDEWRDGERCLIFPNNPDDFLGYGCVYEGYVTEDVPEGDRAGRDNFPVVLVGFGLPDEIWCDCEEGQNVKHCSACFAGAARWFEVAVWQLNEDDLFSWIAGDWILKNYQASGCVWRDSADETWVLQSVGGGVWTLTGSLDEDNTVTFTCTSFNCLTGGSFDYTSSTTSWSGPRTLAVVGRPQPGDLNPCGSTTTSSTTTPQPCGGVCLWGKTGSTFGLISRTCTDGCDCFYPAVCPSDCPYVLTYCNTKAFEVGQGVMPNCTGTTTTTTTPDPGVCGDICLWRYHRDPGYWENYFNSCGGICACPQPDVLTPIDGMGGVTFCETAAAKCLGRCRFKWILFGFPPGIDGGDWFLESSGCSAYADCTCYKPSIPGAVDGQIALVSCESPIGPDDPPDDPYPPNTCTGVCYYCWDGADWDFDKTTCPTSCVCVKPNYPGTYVGEVGTTQCQDQTTTTTTTTPPPCGGHCVYECLDPDGCLPETGQDWEARKNDCGGTPDCGCPDPADVVGSANFGEMVIVDCLPTGTSSTTTTTTTPTTTDPGCSSSGCWARCDRTSVIGDEAGGDGLEWVIIDNCGMVGDCYCDVDSLPSGSCEVEGETTVAVACLDGTTTTTEPGDCASMTCSAHCDFTTLQWVVTSPCNTVPDCACGSAFTVSDGDPCNPLRDLLIEYNCIASTTTTTTTPEGGGCGSCGAVCVDNDKIGGFGWSIVNTCTGDCTCPHDLPPPDSPCTAGDDSYLITACVGGATFTTHGGDEEDGDGHAPRLLPDLTGATMEVMPRVLMPPALKPRSERVVLVAASASPKVQRSARDLAQRCGADYRKAEDVSHCPGSAPWRLSGYLVRYRQAVLLLSSAEGKAGDPFHLIPPAGLLRTPELIGVDSDAEFLAVPRHIVCRPGAALDAIEAKARELGVEVLT